MRRRAVVAARWRRPPRQSSRASLLQALPVDDASRGDHVQRVGRVNHHQRALLDGAVDGFLAPPQTAAERIQVRPCQGDDGGVLRGQGGKHAPFGAGQQRRIVREAMGVMSVLAIEWERAACGPPSAPALTGEHRLHHRQHVVVRAFLTM